MPVIKAFGILKKAAAKSNLAFGLDEKKADAIMKGLEALETAGHHSVSFKTLKANNGNIMGLSFNEYVDLSQQKFTINFNVDSDTITQAPMDVFMYFSTLITM